MSSLQVRVAAVRTEATGILSFDLVHEADADLPVFEAGAHIDVVLPEMPARQYSLCSQPGDRKVYRIAVLREPSSRGGSQFMHERVHVGDRLTISTPRNHFALVPDARRSILVAGGIGVTPLMAMAMALHERGAPFELHYCARSRSRMAFADALLSGSFAANVRTHFDDGDEGQKLDHAALLGKRAEGDHLYVCGPTGFLDWLRNAALAAGWPDEAIHTEYFSAEVVRYDSDSSFEIEVSETGQIITIAKGQTALDGLLAAGLDVPNSCAEGVCGMCMTRVVEGTPDHRDHFLTAAERARNDTFMPCCSRSRTPRLVIAPDY